MTVLLTMLSTTTKAQELQWGLKMGSSLSNVIYTGDSPFEYTTQYEHSIHAGVLANVPLSDRWQIRTGLLMDHRRYRPDEGAGLTQIFARLPVIPTYKISSKFAVGLGMDLNIWLSDLATGDLVGYNLNGLSDRSFDPGIVVRTQYQILKRWTIDLRYVHNLIEAQVLSIIDDQENVLGSVQVQNRSFMLSLEYLLSPQN